MPLPRDVGIEKDNFQKSKIFNEKDSLVNYILNILLMRPGNMPGLPHIGVDIAKYVKNDMVNSLNVDIVKGLIISNCSDLLPYLSYDDLYVGIIRDEDNKQYLAIKIPITLNGNSKEYEDVYYVFYRNMLNNLEFNFVIDNK
jgi:hypothetical protein